MSEQTFITIRNYYKRTIDVDDGDGNVARLPLRIRRFTKEQLIAFSTDLKRCENRAADRYLSRKPDGDEQELIDVTWGDRTVQAPKVSDAEVRRRRLVEMTEDDRARFEALDAADEKFIADFYARTIADHVWVSPRMPDTPDGAPLKLRFESENGDVLTLETGQDLVKAYAGQAAILGAIVKAVNDENRLSAEEKKRLRSLSALIGSSKTSDPTAAGDVPAATAERAEPKASAGSDAATEPSATTRSGSIAT